MSQYKISKARLKEIIKEEYEAAMTRTDEGHGAFGNANRDDDEKKSEKEEEEGRSSKVAESFASINLNCSLTISIPVIISVMGCST